MPHLDHVGIAVGDVEEALRLFRDLLEETPYKAETVEQDGIRTHFLRGGGTKLELLESLRDDSAIRKYLDRRGGGLHHLAFEVDDVSAVLSRMAAAGYEPIDSEPRPGADGKVIAFLHPKKTAGILVELCARQRGVLRERDLVVEGRPITVREAGLPENPPFVMFGNAAGLETIAERLEQTCRVFLVEENKPAPILEALELERVHLAVAGPAVADVLTMAMEIPSRILSLSVICDEVPIHTVGRSVCPTLVVAADDDAEAAIEVRAAIGGSLAIFPGARKELMAAAIEMHVRDSQASFLK